MQITTVDSRQTDGNLFILQPYTLASTEYSDWGIDVRRIGPKDHLCQIHIYTPTFLLRSLSTNHSAVFWKGPPADSGRSNAGRLAFRYSHRHHMLLNYSIQRSLIGRLLQPWLRRGCGGTHVPSLSRLVHPWHLNYHLYHCRHHPYAFFLNFFRIGMAIVRVFIIAISISIAIIITVIAIAIVFIAQRYLSLLSMSAKEKGSCVAWWHNYWVCKCGHVVFECWTVAYQWGYEMRKRAFKVFMSVCCVCLAQWMCCCVTVCWSCSCASRLYVCVGVFLCAWAVAFVCMNGCVIMGVWCWLNVFLSFLYVSVHVFMFCPLQSSRVRPALLLCPTAIRSAMRKSNHKSRQNKKSR